MNEREHANHLDLDLVARHLDGELDNAADAQVRAHLGSCAACRLEARHLARFRSLAADTELVEEAQWERARRLLDQQRPFSRPQVRHLPTRPRWAIPLAAAAALALLLVGVEHLEHPASQHAGAPGGPLRGGPEAPATLVALRPVGEIAAMPDTFAWRDSGDHDSYNLEIYTADLQTVHRQERLTVPFFVAPDSLRAQLRAGTTYLWSVQGYHSLDAGDAAPGGLVPLRALTWLGGSGPTLLPGRPETLIPSR